MKTGFQIKKIPILLFCLFYVFVLNAQKQIKGTIIDLTSSLPVEFVNVVVQGTSIGTLSNRDGMFELNVPGENLDKNITISCIGYQPEIIYSPYHDKVYNIVLEQRKFQLAEVMVKPIDPYPILSEAIKKIAVNYASDAVCLNAYYREMVNTDGAFVKYVDAACKIYYCGYNNKFNEEQASSKYFQFDFTQWNKTNPFPQATNTIPHQNDEVQILAARKSNNLESFVNRWDFEEGLKKFEISGGPLPITSADIVKFRKDIIDTTTWKYYQFIFLGISENNNKDVYKISFTPKTKNKHAIWEGVIYIEKESHAIISLEYSVYEDCDVYLRDKNIEQTIDIKKRKIREEIKKQQVRRVIEHTDQDIKITYSNYQDKWYLSHIRIQNVIKNTGDVFDDIEYNTYLELYVNDIQTQNIQALEDVNIFYTNNYNYLFQQSFKYTPSFWEKYNTPVPTELFKKALSDLEKGESLQKQFEENHQK
jgi:hypothetical protein